MIATTANGHRVLDPWLALLAGDRVWSEAEDPPDAKRRVAGGLELVALSFVVSLMWVVVARSLPQPVALSRSIGAATVATVVAAILAVRPTTIMFGRPTQPAAFVPRILWRGCCFVAMIVAIAVQMPGWPALGAWALGIVIGADVMLSAWALGIGANPVRWWRHFLLSPLHFGVIGALVAVALMPNYLPQFWSFVGPYLALHLGLIVAVLTSRGLVIVAEQLDLELDAARRAAAVSERRHRAHWLHDDVLAEIRLTTLRVQSGELTTTQVVNDLNELDHRLRIRQLDEMFEGGSIRLADILQPHIRRAHTLGIQFTAMPSLDAAGQRVDPHAGRLVGRALSVLLSNAINAGAGSVGLGIDSFARSIRLRVSDDAGGFDFDQIPLGHGLDQLAEELGRENLARFDRPDGSVMVADIPFVHDPTEPSDTGARPAVPEGADAR